LLKYRHRDILKALLSETSEKCAYCESHIVAVSFPHIEHIKPKSMDDELVFKWENLTIACEKCNNQKRDFWDEDNGIVNPYTEDPEEFIYAAGWFILPWSSTIRGQITISKLDLDRGGLVEARRDSIKMLEPLLHALRRETSDTRRGLLIEQLEEEIRSDKPYCLVRRAHVKSQLGNLLGF
jgi:hypothetical protein